MADEMSARFASSTALSNKEVVDFGFLGAVAIATNKFYSGASSHSEKIPNKAFMSNIYYL